MRTDDLSGIVDCVHADRCAGCALIQHSPESQLRHKLERLKKAIDPYAVLCGIACESVIAAPSLTEYRTRTKLMVDESGGIGLFGRGSHDVVDIPQCRVMPPLTHAAVAAMRPLLLGVGVEAIDVREVRDGDEQRLLVTLVAARDAVDSARSCAKRVAEIDGVRAVAVSARDPGAVQLLGRDLVVCHGPEFARDRVDDASPFVRATPGAFVQAHRAQAQRLQKFLIDALETALGTLNGKRIVELHCGEGGLGLRLAQRGAEMLMVDSYEPAVRNLRAAAEEQGLTVEAWALDAGEAVARMLGGEKRIDAVLLDPPRRGLPPALRRALGALRPDVIVYVSCAPETFARDLHQLAWLGYSTDSIVPFDLIPLSAEVESVAILRSSAASAAPRLTVLYEDAEAIVVDKPMHVPTTPQAEHATSLEALARSQFNAPELVVVQPLDATTSGVCILARHGARATVWSEALAAGATRYTALVRGVGRAVGGRRQQAGTRYQRDDVVGGHALITVISDQGRTHQIRRDLASLGDPILGDNRYGDAKSNRHMEHKHGLDRPFLHCAHVSLIAPTTGAALKFEAALAPDLAAVMESLAS